MRKILFLSLFLVVLGGVSLLSAQRLSVGSSAIALSGRIPLQQEDKLGFGLHFLKVYRGEHYAFWGFSYLGSAKPYKDSKVKVDDYTLDLGYMRKIMGDVGRNFFVHAGLFASGGYQYLNEGKTALYDGSRLREGSGFIYGGGAKLSMELYLNDHIALSATGKGIYYFGTNIQNFYPVLEVGFRYNF